MSSPSPSPSPGPAKSRWSRMGAAVRRSSTLLQKGSGSLSSRNNSTESLATLSRTPSKQKLDTTPATLNRYVSSAAVETIPTAIPETPRENSAVAENPAKGAKLSPINQQTSTKPSSRAATPPPAPAPAVVPDDDPMSPQGYVPPPLVDTTAGNPGAFTDDPDSLPQPIIATDPFASNSNTDLRGNSEAGHSKEEVQFAEEPDVLVDSPKSHTTSLSAQPEAPKPFFEKPVVKGMDKEPTNEFAAAVEANTIIASSAEPSHSPKYIPQVLSPQNESDDDDYLPNPLPSHYEQRALSAAHTPVPVPQNLSPAPIFSLPTHDPTYGTDIWGHAERNNSVRFPNPHERVEESRAPQVTTIARQERVVEAPKVSTHLDYIHMPKPQPSPGHIQPPVVNEEDVSRNAVSMPLPAFHDVIPSRSVRARRSDDSISIPRYVVTNERQPLLGAGSSKQPAYVRNDTFGVLDDSPVAPANGNGNHAAWVPNNSHATTPGRLQELGWLEYHLPDGSFYYLHPARKIVTDLNLRLEKVLADVSSWVEMEMGNGGFGSTSRYPGSTNHGNGQAGHGKAVETPGVEVWLRDAESKKKRRFKPVKCYVDHHARTVIVDRGHHGGRAKHHKEDDQLDMEFRYWSFVETHPAHATLSMKAKAEALDALTWAWTDRLLPSHRAIPAPFAQDECQELMTLLRSFGAGNPDDHGIHNRIVARVQLRVALWRQKYFRPNKPFPKDVLVGSVKLPTRRRPFYRVLSDVVVSILCLGLPWLFVGRSRGSMGEEHGSMGSARGVGAIFVVGACTCIAAAIILSASITFLSLQGLALLPRIAILVAIVFATLAMASTLVAVFKHKADVQRTSNVLDFEGNVGLTGRGIILSLPLVFLSYSLISFLTAIGIHTIRGGMIFGPSLTLQSVGSGMKWPVLGAAGMLMAIVWATHGSLSRP
ncbi:hypothetical protein BKA70DRAFT_1222523 [Coprinopsis sp. MPI-PUGE-AT-0042]|nr:hypothetical protein BKA70DRAFT_1222523 [Coprinopsis sp. MPI-PUGE-AT-0042]